MPIVINDTTATITNDNKRRFFYVPSNVATARVNFDLIGGGGGGGGSDSPYGGGNGGAAGVVSGTIIVTAGDFVEVFVGGAGIRGQGQQGGAPGGAGGGSFNGYGGGTGGRAGTRGSSGGGGGGGGATIIKVNGIIKAIAAGGAGGGGAGHWNDPRGPGQPATATEGKFNDDGDEYYTETTNGAYGEFLNTYGVDVGYVTVPVAAPPTPPPAEPTYTARGVLKDILCAEPRVNGSATVYYHDGAGGEYTVTETRLAACPIATATVPSHPLRGTLKDILCTEPRVDGSATVYYHDGSGGEYTAAEKRLTACPIPVIVPTHPAKGVLKDILCDEPKINGSATVYYHDGAGGEYTATETRLAACPIATVVTVVPACPVDGTFNRESTETITYADGSYTVFYAKFVFTGTRDASGNCQERVGEYTETNTPAPAAAAPIVQTGGIARGVNTQLV